MGQAGWQPDGHQDIYIIQFHSDDRDHGVLRGEGREIIPDPGTSRWVASKPVNLGDEGLFWISDGRMYIHYRLGGNIVFSWLDDGGNPDLDEGWFLELMGLQEIKISGR